MAKGNDVYCGQCTARGGSAKWATKANNKAAFCNQGQCVAHIYKDLTHVRPVLQAINDELEPSHAGRPPSMSLNLHAPCPPPPPGRHRLPREPAQPAPANHDQQLLHGLQDVIAALVEQVAHLRAQNDETRAQIAEIHKVILENLNQWEQDSSCKS